MSLQEVWDLPHFPLLGKLLYWHAKMADYCGEWVKAHKDGAEDTWTAGKAGQKLRA